MGYNQGRYQEYDDGSADQVGVDDDCSYGALDDLDGQIRDVADQ